MHGMVLDQGQDGALRAVPMKRAICAKDLSAPRRPHPLQPYQIATSCGLQPLQQGHRRAAGSVAAARRRRAAARWQRLAATSSSSSGSVGIAKPATAGGAACASGLPGDAKTATCMPWCSAKSRISHCARCQCRRAICNAPPTASKSKAAKPKGTERERCRRNAGGIDGLCHRHHHPRDDLAILDSVRPR